MGTEEAWLERRSGAIGCPYFGTTRHGMSTFEHGMSTFEHGMSTFEPGIATTRPGWPETRSKDQAPPPGQGTGEGEDMVKAPEIPWYEHSCSRCGYVWYSRTAYPSTCAYTGCRSPYWDRPRRMSPAPRPPIP